MNFSQHLELSLKDRFHAETGEFFAETAAGSA